MELRILSYSISLALCVLLALPAQAQNSTSSPPNRKETKKKEKKKDENEIQYPLYNGMDFSIDLWGAGAKLFGSDFFSTEVSADVNLKNRFFPTVEVGYGATNAWSDYMVHYKSNAPYLRIGLDYNAFYKKKHGHMLMVGLRYGMSSFKYDVNTLSEGDADYSTSMSDINLTDDVWKDNAYYNHTGMKGSMQWIEFCVGIRAHILKNLYMGWTVRFKYRISSSSDTYGDPWYVPGFGTFGSNTTGVTYTITYRLPSFSK